MSTCIEWLGKSSFEFDRETSWIGGGFQDGGGSLDSSRERRAEDAMDILACESRTDLLRLNETSFTGIVNVSEYFEDWRDTESKTITNDIYQFKRIGPQRFFFYNSFYLRNLVSESRFFKI